MGKLLICGRPEKEGIETKSNATHAIDRSMTLSKELYFREFMFLVK